MDPTVRIFLRGIMVCLSIAAIIVLSFRLNQPPPVVPADAPADVFSAERAAVHLPFIASVPNPIGSKANEAVRHYIVDQLEEMGLEVHMHNTQYYYAQRAANLANILTRIPGTGNGEAILFMGHYDTVISAPGASDNGAAVVTLLEVIRMLQHHEPLQNDLIFFFPDGEEYGLLGAQAFMAEHPWVDDIVMVVNLEAMGTGGQSLMFETGNNNQKAIKSYAQAVPYPTGNALSVEIYNRMPNATDFDVFKRRGFQGLNFAYIGNSFDYHTAGDNIENTNLRSIQHHGEHAAALALHLGNAAPSFQAEQNAVYFNTVGYGFVWYPYKWVPFISICTFVLAAGVIALGIIRKHINPVRMVFGFIAHCIKLFILYTAFNAVVGILSSNYPGDSYRLLQYNQTGILLGFSLLAAAFSVFYYHMLMHRARIWKLLYIYSIVIILLWWSGSVSLTHMLIGLLIIGWLYFAHQKPSHHYELLAGALSLWAILMLAVSLAVPGASYLFTWPLLFVLLPLTIAFLKNREHETSLTLHAVFLVFAFPVIAWFPVLIYLFQQAMGLQTAGIAMVVTGLMVGLLIPAIRLLTREKAWFVPGLVFLAGLVILLANSMEINYDERHRKQNHIIYATHGGSGKSYWITHNKKVDEWTRQFLTGQPDTISLKEFYPYSTAWTYGKIATGHSPIPPTAEVLTDTISQGERKLSLRIRLAGRSDQLIFYFYSGGEPLSLRVNDLGRHRLNAFTNTGWYRFLYLAPDDEEIRLTLYTSKGQSIGVHLNEMDYSGIPNVIDATERPPHMMSSGDHTMASNYFTF